MEFNIKNNNNNKKPIKPEGDRTVSKQKKLHTFCTSSDPLTLETYTNKQYKKSKGN